MPEKSPRLAHEDFKKYSTGEPFSPKLREALAEGKLPRDVVWEEELEKEIQRWEEMGFSEQQAVLREMAAAKEESYSRAREEFERGFALTEKFFNAIGNYRHGEEYAGQATINNESVPFFQTLFAFIQSGELENYRRFCATEEGKNANLRRGFIMERLAHYDTAIMSEEEQEEHKERDEEQYAYDFDRPGNPLPLRDRDFVGEEELFERFRQKWEAHEGGVKHPDLLYSHYFGLNPEREVDVIVEVKSSFSEGVRETLSSQLKGIVPDMRREGVGFSPNLKKFLLLPRDPYGYAEAGRPGDFEGYQIIFTNFSSSDLYAAEKVLTTYANFGERGLERFAELGKEKEAASILAYPWHEVEVDPSFLALIEQNEEGLLDWLVVSARGEYTRGSRIILGPELDGVPTFFQFFHLGGGSYSPGELQDLLRKGKMWVSIFHYYPSEDNKDEVSFRAVNISFIKPKSATEETVEGLTLTAEDDKLVIKGTESYSLQQE